MSASEQAPKRPVRHVGVAQRPVPGRGSPRGRATLRVWDAQWQRPAVQVLAGQYFLARGDVLLSTVLGSCIAACLWDARAQIGGMNHFLLPASAHIRQEDAGRYGNCAMHMLFEAMLHSGARREFMQAKIFGGARIMQALASTPVGADNTAFVRRWLHRQNIPIAAQDVLGTCPRKVLFFAASGTALVRRLPHTAQGIN